MLTAERSQSQHVHLEYHLQQASIFFFANRWILLDRSVSISKRLKYFNAVASSVACFGSGHRAISNFLPASFPIFCSLHHGNNNNESRLYLTLSIHVLCSDVWSAPATPLVPCVVMTLHVDYPPLIMPHAVTRLVLRDGGMLACCGLVL